MGKAKKPAGKDWSMEWRRSGGERIRQSRVIFHTDFACRSLICFVESSVHEGGRVKDEENKIVCSSSTLPSFSSAIRPPMELVHPICQSLSFSLCYSTESILNVTLSLANVSTASLFNSLVRPNLFPPSFSLFLPISLLSRLNEMSLITYVKTRSDWKSNVSQ